MVPRDLPLTTRLLGHHQFFHINGHVSLGCLQVSLSQNTVLHLFRLTLGTCRPGIQLAVQPQQKHGTQAEVWAKVLIAQFFVVARTVKQ